MTPAIELLENNEILYSILEYKHNTNDKSYGKEAVNSLGLKEDVVFKTLVLSLSNKDSHIVALVPVSKTLNLKNLAKILKVKKVLMMDTKRAEKITGYLQGAISPLAQKKKAKTFIDKSSLSHEEIYISGGKRGIEIGINPNSLAKLSNAEFVSIV